MSNQNLEDQERNQAFADAVNYFKQACDIFEREATRVRQEQESIDSMSKKLEHVHFYNSVNCDRPGECSPEKDCLR